MLRWIFGLEFWVKWIYLITLNLNIICKEKQCSALSRVLSKEDSKERLVKEYSSCS